MVVYTVNKNFVCLFVKLVMYRNLLKEICLEKTKHCVMK